MEVSSRENHLEVGDFRASYVWFREGFHIDMKDREGISSHEDGMWYSIQAKNQWNVTAFPLYNRRHFDLWPCSGWSFNLRCLSTRVFSQITLSTQPRINVGFKHLCLVLNRTLCIFHNFTRDDHPKLALFCFGSGSTWLNRPAFRGPSAAPGVLIFAQIKPVEKHAIDTWLKRSGHTDLLVIFGWLELLWCQWQKVQPYQKGCSNCFWWYVSFGHSNMESWMSKCICGGHTKTHGWKKRVCDLRSYSPQRDPAVLARTHRCICRSFWDTKQIDLRKQHEATHHCRQVLSYIELHGLPGLVNHPRGLESFVRRTTATLNSPRDWWDYETAVANSSCPVEKISQSVILWKYAARKVSA